MSVSISSHLAYRPMNRIMLWAFCNCQVMADSRPGLRKVLPRAQRPPRPARRGGHNDYSMANEMTGKRTFPLRRKPRRN